MSTVPLPFSLALMPAAAAVPALSAPAPLLVLVPALSAPAPVPVLVLALLVPAPAALLLPGPILLWWWLARVNLGFQVVILVHRENANNSFLCVSAYNKKAGTVITSFHTIRLF
eukprot:1149977-Pelagomonas_calceolata.AAC.4